MEWIRGVKAVIMPKDTRKKMTKSGLVALLRTGGVEAFNRWREKNSAAKVDLSKANFEGMTLNGVNFSGVCLQEARFRGAKLVGASLKRALCDEADFRFTDLTRADFTGSRLTHVHLEGAKMVGTVFRRAEMWNIHIPVSYDLDFSQAKLAGAELRWMSSSACG